MAGVLHRYKPHGWHNSGVPHDAHTSNIAVITSETPDKNLRLNQRKFDYVFIVFFCWAFVSCMISDAIPTLGIVQSPDSPNLLA